MDHSRDCEAGDETAIAKLCHFSVKFLQARSYQSHSEVQASSRIVWRIEIVSSVRSIYDARLARILKLFCMRI